jgi:hypothetical protein
LLGLVAAVAGLVAGAFFAPPTIAWLCGGTLAALVVGALSPRGRAQIIQAGMRDLTPEPAESSRPVRKLELWQVMTAFLALLLLIVAITLETPFFTKSTATNSFIFNEHSLVLLLTELGFALIIALAISVTIEKQARDRDHAATEAMRKRIAEDVFRGVFSAHLPADYINTVVDRNLNVQLIRPSLRIVEDISEIESGLLSEINKSDLLRCDRLIEYTLRNVTSKVVTENLRLFFPVKRAEVAEHTVMDFLSVGDRHWTAEEISVLRIRNKDNSAVHYEWPVIISPGETITVKLHSRHFKYRSDSEIWSTVYPTMRFELIFRCSIPLSSLGLRNSSLDPPTSEYVEPEKGLGNWTVEGPLLPSDSVTYWWSAFEDHGPGSRAG